MLDLYFFIVDRIVPFVVVFTALVFFHELGHYLIARWCGVRVETFSIGFGRELFGWRDRAGTRWRVALLPLGGYVRMFGGDRLGASGDAEQVDLTADERRVAFPYKSVGQRSAVVAGGPFANFVLAIILLALLFGFAGERIAPPVAGTVLAESAAAAAGMRDGDRVLSIDGTPIATFQDLQRQVEMSRGAPLELQIQRGADQLALTVTPRLVEDTDPFGNAITRPLLGISQSELETVYHDPLSALRRAVEETWTLSVMTVQALGQIIVGTRPADDIGGVIRIAELSGEVAQVDYANLIQLIALLSIGLGLINLLPIPVLDGGHLLFYAIEAIRGRPASQRVVEVAFRFGLLIVIGLFMTTTVIDLLRFDGVVAFLRSLGA